MKCPKCGSTNTGLEDIDCDTSYYRDVPTCHDCGHQWANDNKQCPECGGAIFHWCYSCATECESNPNMPELQEPGKVYLHTLGDNDCERWTPGCKCRLGLRWT